MTTLVTGGAGFIGSHLVDALLDLGHEVAVLDNFSTGRQENIAHIADHIEIVECDVGSKGKWDQKFSNVDWVFHLAALADIVPSIQDPESYFRSNVVGTFNVLQASTLAKVDRLVYVASSSSYGIPKSYPTPESAAKDPQYPYALTKHMGEELALHWQRVYQVPVISLRFFNVYGPRARTSGTYGAVFGVFLAQKLAGEPFTVVGNGDQTRDFTYVSDAVSALITAASSDNTGVVYNVGSGKTVSINTIVNLLGGEKVHIPKRPGEPDCTFAAISKIKKELMWEPKISIEEGVSLLLKNISYWEGAPVWTPSKIADATKDWFNHLGNSSTE